MLYSGGSTIKSHLEELYAKFVLRPLRPASAPQLTLAYPRCRYGTFITRNSYFICRDPTVTERIFKRLRYSFPSSSPSPSPSTDASPLPRNLGNFRTPTTLGGLPISSIRDLTLGYDSSNPPTYEPSLPNSGGEMITWIAGEEGGERVVLTVR